MPRRAADTAFEPSCLFPDEDEIARAVLGPKRARMWPSLATVLERRGFPRVDPQFGGRYWPKVKDYLDRHQHLGQDGALRVEHAERVDGRRVGPVRARS